MGQFSPTAGRTTKISSMDGHDPDAVAAFVAGWLGDDVSIAEPPVTLTGGFDTAVHAVRFAGDSLSPEWRGPLVARVQPEAWRLAIAEHEAVAHNFCSTHGYPAPRVLAVIKPDEGFGLPIQVIERAPGTTLLAALARRPWRGRRYFGLMGRLHARLHALPADRWPGSASGRETLADHRLALPRRLRDDRTLDDAAFAAALDRVEHALPRLMASRDHEKAFCHGDFHPLNILVDGDDAAVIDWTSACVDDRHGDVSRMVLLFAEATAGAPIAFARVVMRGVVPLTVQRYLRAYEAEARRPLDRARLEQWEPVHLIHDWARAWLTLQGSGKEARQMRPEVIDWIKARLDTRRAQ
jgi:aminoglycoside phosphotransferase (APT) family kinase protein